MAQCIPRAVGVPGLRQPPTWPGIAALTGHPEWPGTAPRASTSVPRGLDDPRWQAALRHGHPQAVGAGEDATFRALYSQQGEQKALFLSWHALVDGAPHPGDDVLWVGFERTVGNPLIIQIEPFNSGANRLSTPVSAIAAITLDTGSTTGTPLSSLPQWISANTHAWFDSGTNRWAVQMRVPINEEDGDEGLNIADTFRMWYELTVRQPDDPTRTPPEQLVAYRWPYTAAVVTTTTAFPAQTHFPPLNGDPGEAWDTFHLSTGPSDPNCPTTGFVSISLMDVGTRNAPSSRIILNAENTFEAKPLNRTSAPIPAEAIEASFRIANWGSVADPLAPWDRIPTSTGTNPAKNTMPIPDGAKGSNTFTWTLNPEERNQFEPTGTRHRHQCVLVELSGAGLVFRPSSVWRNMDFATASTFSRLAEISSVGLGPAPGGASARDTYLLVEKLNMPSPVPVDGRPVPPEKPPDTPQSPQIREPEDDDTRWALETAAKQLQTEEERLDASMPTYRVHTYHDTGQTVVRRGTTFRVLTPATSFGYYVEHDGTPAGWNDEILGAGEISPGFYRLSVPTEGVAHVTTVIEAVDPGPGGPLGCLPRLLRLPFTILRTTAAVLRRLLGR